MADASKVATAALALAREGARISALDVARPLPYPGYGLGTTGELASLAAACRELGQECLTFAADVRDDVAVTAAVNETVRAFGRSISCSTTPASAPTVWPTS